MKNHYYFHGQDAKQKAAAFASKNREFRPKIYEQHGRVCVTLG